MKKNIDNNSQIETMVNKANMNTKIDQLKRLPIKESIEQITKFRFDNNGKCTYNEFTGKPDNSISINIKDNYINDFGNGTDLRGDLITFWKKYKRVNYKEAVSELSEEFLNTKSVNNKQNSKELFNNYFNKKMINADTLYKYKIRQNKYNIEYIYYNHENTEIGRKHRNLINKNKNYWTVKGLNNPLYGMQLIKDYDFNKPLYICEGEPDTLVMLQNGYQAIGVSGKNGIGNDKAFIKYIYKDNIFNKFSNIVLCFDRDVKPDIIQKTINKIGKSCKVLDWKLYTGTHKDNNDVNDIYVYCKTNNIEFDIDNYVKDFGGIETNKKKSLTTYETKILLAELKKIGCIVAINTDSVNRYIIDELYFAHNDNNNLIKLFVDNKLNGLFLKLFYKHITDNKIEDIINFNINNINIELTSLLLDRKIDIIFCQTSNLSVIKANDIKISSNVKEGVIITTDKENIIYNDLKPKLDSEIDYIFDQLYNDNSIIIKSHIISAILNVDFGNKHFLFISGTPQLGKSKTAELISRIITNNYLSNDIKNLDKLWLKFFSTRSPVLDNIDIAKNLSPDIVSDLSEIITATKINKNVRYTQSGINFNCDVYPIITTINPDLLYRKDTTTLKSRAIMINLNYNEHAKNNINSYYNDINFINKCRLHFYQLASNFLNRKDKSPAPINHRAKNFFDVMFFLDNDRAIEYEKTLIDQKEYNEVTEMFLKMLNEMLNEMPLQEIELKVSEWTEYFHKFTNNKYEKVTERTLFKSNIDKYTISDIIDKYLVIKKRSNKGNIVLFKSI